MGNRQVTFWLPARALCFWLLSALATPDECSAKVYSDGGYHAITLSKDQSVQVSAGTHVDILGGWSGEPLSVRGSSSVDMYAGTLLCGGFYDDTLVNFYGGILWNGFSAEDRAVVNICDFDIPVTDQIFIFDDAVVTVYGQDFSWGYGSFSRPSVGGEILTGTLVDGGSFEWRIYTGTLGGSGMAPPARDGGRMVLAPVPEPATALLLVVGLLMMRRRRQLAPSA